MAKIKLTEELAYNLAEGLIQYAVSDLVDCMGQYSLTFAQERELERRVGGQLDDEQLDEVCDLISNASVLIEVTFS